MSCLIESDTATLVHPPQHANISTLTAKSYADSCSASSRARDSDDLSMRSL